MSGRVTSPTFIGRGAEQARLGAALARAAVGQPSMVLIEGEAGIGKSRLLRQLIEQASRPGNPEGLLPFLVLEGGCVALGDGGLPFAPIVEVLRSLVAQPGPSGPPELGPASAELGRLVPELAAPRDMEPAPFQRGDWLRTRLFEAFLDLLLTLAQASPVLLVIEDIQWADDSTRDLLAFLARNLRSERLLIATTIRTDDLGPGHPLLAWRAEMERLPVVERMSLGGLDRDELSGLLRGILDGPASPSLLQAVLVRSDGNPFFVEELVAAGAEARSGALRELLLVRVNAVSSAGRTMLGAAAVAGRRVDSHLLAQVVGLDDAGFDLAARELITAHLLVIEPSAAGELFAFRHALVQEAVYADLLPSQRRRLHTALAEALERRGPTLDGGGASRMAELAFHWDAAADRPRALVAALAAAHGADEEYAFAAAGRQYERAIELWPAVPEADQLTGTDLAAVLSDASRAAGLAAQTSHSLDLAQAALEALDPSTDRTRVAIYEERAAWAATEHGDLELATELLTAAIGRLSISATPSQAAALVSSAFARNQYLRGIDGAIPACHRAIAIARAAGARQSEADALVTLGGALRDVGDPAGAAIALHQAIAIGEEIDDGWELGRAYDQLAGALVDSGDIEGAIRLTAAGFERGAGPGTGRPVLGAKARLEQALRLIYVGRWDEALEQLDETLRFAPEGTMRLLYCATAGLLDGLAGRFEQSRGLLAEGRAIEAGRRDARWAAWFHAVWARLELLEGRPDAAASEIRAGLDGVLRGSENVSILGRFGIEAQADLAEAGRARRRPGEVERARGEAVELLARLDELVAAFPDQASPAFSWLARDVAASRAELARLEGHSEPERWSAVSSLWAALPHPYEVAYARYREGEALLSEGRRAEAEAAIQAAHQTASELGARPLRESIEGLARRARIDLAARATPVVVPADTATQPAPDPYGLTGREREIIALLAEGRSNRQIGDALFISPSTVGVHVSNILGKLAVTSRVEAAAVAVRLGLAG